MNIKDAKKQTQNAVLAYLEKDKFGGYKTPVVRQRPVLIIGAPGIGKTAIMEQIAQELNIGLVAYSMTHHTRQSAIGLPYIEKCCFDGKEYSVSEYTMSEIISSVHRYIQKTGLREGILFLDEINCISETLAPAMLQFLQYKTFGNTPIPQGWVIVTAGNPPEFNKSVREFDVATLDRVKKINVEPDYDVWREYAVKKGIHSAIITYLDVKKDNFYAIETTVDGKSFVTARGWEDLSQMIQLYEEMDIAVDESLIIQYIQYSDIAKDFSVYYDLYNKYKADYKVLEILDGNYDDEIMKRAGEARFDERLTLISLFADTIVANMKEVLWEDDNVAVLFEVLKEIKALCGEGKNIVEILKNAVEEKKHMLETKIEAGILDKTEENRLREIIDRLEKYTSAAAKNPEFDTVKNMFNACTAQLDEKTKKTKAMLDNMFDFIDKVYGKEQEMSLVVAEFTSNSYSAKFIGRYGSDKYFENNKQTLFYERQKDIMSEIGVLNSLEQE